MILRKNIDKSTDAVELVVFDLENGEPKWISKPHERGSSSFLPKNIIYGDDLYVIGIEPIDRGNKRSIYEKPWTLMILDARSGRFLKVLRVVSLNGWNLQDYQPHRLVGDHLYGHVLGRVWGLDLRSGELIFASDDRLKVVDARPEAEILFGKLP